ncbi:phage tail protein [Marinibactrum halimedae]|uniref:Tail assembly protein n=1 Tax=Marinibactrum halimedae TaxID=1444977 RepID=A0AA37T5L0_9GAMM|nr:phage tail protein [Marinibactrum halimedae]MCD9460787.1 phage tail protein [Marinibactrum halimedae]GLS27375.1 tail assembly protein [Marinibactrum halimedae]
MMMLLGSILFSVETSAFDQLQRSTQYQWASQNRLGHPVLKHTGIGGPAHQFIGPGDDTITLNGVMYPQYKGGPLQMSLMRLTASLGKALPLIDGNGFPHGRWIIESIQETRSVLFSNGAPRKIEFSLSLKKYHEDLMLF